MKLTLNELENNYKRTLQFTLDFKKEIIDSSSITNISDAIVEGAYQFLDNKINFYFEVSLTVTIIASDTNNPVEVPMHVIINDDVSDEETSEYKINNNRVDLYELIWGWVAAELPYGVFEHKTTEVF